MHWQKHSVYMGRNKLILSMCTRFWRTNLKRRSASSKTQEFSMGVIHLFFSKRYFGMSFLPPCSIYLMVIISKKLLAKSLRAILLYTP